MAYRPMLPPPPQLLVKVIVHWQPFVFHTAVTGLTRAQANLSLPEFISSAHVQRNTSDLRAPI